MIIFILYHFYYKLNILDRKKNIFNPLIHVLFKLNLLYPAIEYLFYAITEPLTKFPPTPLEQFI